MKTLLSAAILAQASGALITEGTTTYVSGTHADYACHQCLAEGYRYCSTDTTFARHSTTITNTGKCVAAGTTCSSGTALEVGSGQTVEVAQLACPTLVSVCGAANTLWTTQADTSATSASISLSAVL